MQCLFINVLAGSAICAASAISEIQENTNIINRMSVAQIDVVQSEG